MRLNPVFHVLSFLFILTVTLHVKSQTLEMTESDFDFNLSSTSVHKIIGHDSSFFYVLKHQSNQYYIEKLDKNLNLIKAEPIKLYEGLRTYDFESIAHFHNEIIVFSSRRRFDDNSIFYHKIDKESLTSSTDFIKLAHIEFIKGNWADFHFAISRRETKLLIACRTKLQLSKVQFNEYYVFGKNMELIWQKKDYIEFKGQGPRDNKYLVDDHGNISILSLLKRSTIFDLMSEIKNIYTIYRYTNLGETYFEYPITFPEKYIRGLRISADDKGDLICAGLFSEMHRQGIKGTFFFRINPFDGKIYETHFHEFENEFISTLAENKEPVIADSELMKYELTDIIYLDNGQLIIIAEQLFEQNFNTYNNLLVSCIDSGGNLAWKTVIPKKQDFNVEFLKRIEVEPADYRDLVIETGIINMEVENLCSYALLAPLDKNEIIIFYNDNIKNLNPGKLWSFSRPRKSYLVGVSIDEFGNVKKQEVRRWKKKSLYPEPIRYYHNLHETIVIPAFRGRKYNYYKISAL